VICPINPSFTINHLDVIDGVYGLPMTMIQEEEEEGLTFYQDQLLDYFEGRRPLRHALPSQYQSTPAQDRACLTSPLLRLLGDWKNTSATVMGPVLRHSLGIRTTISFSIDLFFDTITTFSASTRSASPFATDNASSFETATSTLAQLLFPGNIAPISIVLADAAF
jgi:hypothetical protein